MKKLSLKEVKRRIRNHEALPDDVVKWYPKLMSRYTIRKAKRKPDGFTGKESRPRLKRYGKGEYRRSARSKELYPRVFVKNPKNFYVGPDNIRQIRHQAIDAMNRGAKYVKDFPSAVTYHWAHGYVSAIKGLKRQDYSEYPILPDEGGGVPLAYNDGYDQGLIDSGLSDMATEQLRHNPSRISRIKSHVKAHLDEDQRDIQKEIDEDDELKMWLDTNPKFSAAQRRKYAASGIALPDGSFPIRNRKDLMDALHDLGRTKHYAAAKKHIIKRARALGLTADLNPEWVRRKGKKRNPKRVNLSTLHRLGLIYQDANGKWHYKQLPWDSTYKYANSKRGAVEGAMDAYRTGIERGMITNAPKEHKQNPKRYRRMRNGDLVLAR